MHGGAGSVHELAEHARGADRDRRRGAIRRHQRSGARERGGDAAGDRRRRARNEPALYPGADDVCPDGRHRRGDSDSDRPEGAHRSRRICHRRGRHLSMHQRRAFRRGRGAARSDEQGSQRERRQRGVLHGPEGCMGGHSGRLPERDRHGRAGTQTEGERAAICRDAARDGHMRKGAGAAERDGAGGRGDPEIPRSMGRGDF